MAQSLVRATSEGRSCASRSPANRFQRPSAATTRGSEVVPTQQKMRSSPRGATENSSARESYVFLRHEPRCPPPGLRARPAASSRPRSRSRFPLLPDDYLGMVDPLLSRRTLRGRVEAVTVETTAADGTPTAVSLTIRPGHGWNGHTAGQYARLGVDVDGVRHWRAYSLTSPPDRADGRITVTTKAIPDGLVSNHARARRAPAARRAWPPPRATSSSRRP